MSSLETTLRRCFAEILRANGQAAAGELTPDTVLLESGLDSLGFAMLVARLEEELGYDPFLIMTEPVYPRTFGEFLAIYETHRPRA